MIAGHRSFDLVTMPNRGGSSYDLRRSLVEVEEEAVTFSVIQHTPDCSPLAVDRLPLGTSGKQRKRHQERQQS